MPLHSIPSPIMVILPYQSGQKGIRLQHWFTFKVFCMHSGYPICMHLGFRFQIYHLPSGQVNRSKISNITTSDIQQHNYNRFTTHYRTGNLQVLYGPSVYFHHESIRYLVGFPTTNSKISITIFTSPSIILLQITEIGK